METRPYQASSQGEGSERGAPPAELSCTAAPHWARQGLSGLGCAHTGPMGVGRPHLRPGRAITGPGGVPQAWPSPCEGSLNLTPLLAAAVGLNLHSLTALQLQCWGTSPSAYYTPVISFMQCLFCVLLIYLLHFARNIFLKPNPFAQVGWCLSQEDPAHLWELQLPWIYGWK